MKIALTRDVKVPTRGTSKSAGLDFYVPNDFETTWLKRGDKVIIPSGVRVKLPQGYALIGFNKSGVATKKGLQIGACVVDEDYQGEIHIHLTKIEGMAVSVEPGEKIAQFILLPVAYEDVEVVDAKYIFESITERGEGAFGSTGNK